MPLKLLDGPAAGLYMVRRAPYYLRAVVAGDKQDVLDQPDDEPTASEKVYIYERDGDAGTVHINMGRRKGGGFYALAEYRWLPSVDGDKLRAAAAWAPWALKTARKES